MIELPVSLSNISVGKTTARVSLKIDRNWLGLEKADEMFCERRLLGRLILGGKDDAPGQTRFIEEEKLEGVFDTKSFSVNAERIAAGVTFALGEIDLETLPHFSSGTGRLVVDSIEDIPEEDKKAARKEAKAAQATSKKAEGPWRSVPVDNVYGDKPRVVKALHAAGLETMGQLSDFCNKGQSYQDVKGIGLAAATWMEEQDVEFWAQNPQDQDDDPFGDEEDEDGDE